MANSSTRIAANPTIPVDRDILVCIFQRGAADGLNSLVPYFDGDYYTHRGGIAVPAPDLANPASGIELSSEYALHPALAPLQSIYSGGDLALVHATGVPHGSRSHFAAQGLIERGVVDKAGPTTGWLGRHLASITAASTSAFRTVSISGNVPVALTGASEPLAISNLSEFSFDQGIIDSGYPTVLAELFKAPLPFFAPAGAALGAIEELQDARLDLITPENGAVYANTPTAGKLAQVAKLIKSDLPVEVVCLDSDGWDHHERLPEFVNASLSELADALAAFYLDLGGLMQRVTVLVYTEFGRRIAANGSFGVDHGTGALAYLMGGAVNGGQIISNWPGLDVAASEDLQITTDLRTVLSEMLNKRVGGVNDASVFPGFTNPGALNLFSA